MRNLFKIFFITFILISCQNEAEKNPVQKVDWESKQTEINDFSSFTQGKTYLPVYSHIYNLHENTNFDLTSTISIRNISLTDTIYILKADYYNTSGNNIRQYVKKPIFVKPMETLEIVIYEQDIEGGSGANFVFEWAIDSIQKNPPLFDGVMISTYGQQGISFTTKGIQINE